MKPFALLFLSVLALGQDASKHCYLGDTEVPCTLELAPHPLPDLPIELSLSLCSESIIVGKTTKRIADLFPEECQKPPDIILGPMEFGTHDCRFAVGIGPDGKWGRKPVKVTGECSGVFDSEITLDRSEEKQDVPAIEVDAEPWECFTPHSSGCRPTDGNGKPISAEQWLRSDDKSVRQYRDSCADKSRVLLTAEDGKKWCHKVGD